MRFFILVFFLFLLNTKCLFGAHIVGGEIEMKYVGDSLGDYRYRISLIQYFDCYQGGNITNTGPDNSVTYSIFRTSDGKLMETRTIFIISQTFVPYTNPACAVGFICTQKVVYSSPEPFYITLNPDKFDDPEGYDIVWERCCRNGSIKNLIEPGWNGMTYTLHFPPIRKDGEHFVNSSPRLFPPLSDYACINQLFYTDFAGTDDDGDSIVYSLAAPLDDQYDNNYTKSICTPSSSNYNPGLCNQLVVASPSPPPHPIVNFKPGYNVDNMIPGDPKLSVSSSGFLTVKPTSLGLFVFSVKFEEYRDGVKLGEGRRDFQMLVVNGCDPPIPPDAGVKLPGETEFYNEVDTIRFTVSEKKCFDFFVTDQNVGTNIKLEALGVNFKLSDDILSFTEGVINQAGDTLKVEVCIADCPYVKGEPYLIDLIASDDACPLPQKDTVRLIIEIKSPENQDPYFVGKPDTTKIKIPWNSQYSTIISGVDPDYDTLTLDFIHQGYVPEENGIFVTNNFNVPGKLESSLLFDANCKKYNYNDQNKFLFGLVLDDKDTCDLLNSDTIFYELEVELPENTDPKLTSSEDITNEVPSRPNYSEIIKDSVELSGTFSMKLFSDDVDNDSLLITASGIDFDYMDMGATFSADNYQRGHVEGLFNWNLECVDFKYDNTKTYKINFVTEDIDQCQEVNSDTIQLILNIVIPENKSPKITNLNAYDLIVNRPFQVDIIATEPDNEMVYLDMISNDPGGNFSFDPSSGIGSTSSTLFWTPSCEFLGEDFSSKSYNLTFQATDDRCPNPKKTIKIIKFLVSRPDSSEYKFAPPNAFSPNGDRKNDTYKLSGLQIIEQNLPKDECDDNFLYIAFYDRTGIEVYRSYDRNFEWDGSGLESGTYYYYIKYSKKDSKYNYKGSISLIY